MSRPGPLQDWPLTQALASNFRAGAPPPSSKRPHKRPRSPGAPNLVSPAKRRILSQEGLYSPKKVSLAAIPFPSSPVQKLSFGQGSATTSSPGNKPTPHTPKKPIAEQEIDDYFSSPVTTPTSSKRTPDSSSIHYPGFDIYFDAGSVLPSDVFTLPSAPPSPAAKSAQKENQRPKRTQGKKSIGKRVPEIRVHDEHSHPMFGVVGMDEALARTEKTESELQSEEWARRRAEEDATDFVTLSLTGRRF